VGFVGGEEALEGVEVGGEGGGQGESVDGDQGLGLDAGEEGALGGVRDQLVEGVEEILGCWGTVRRDPT